MLRTVALLIAVGLLLSSCEVQADTVRTTTTTVKKLCAPGAHWYRHKVWRDGKRVWVGHCVPNRKY